MTNDGTQHADGVNPGPCLGDYPHIGADANGIYLTTNAYPWGRDGFSRRADLRALEGAARRRGRDRDDAAHRHDRHGQCSERRRLDAAGLHRLAGAVAGHELVRTANGGTEYFLSSNAADEAQKPGSGARRHRTSTTSSSGR